MGGMSKRKYDVLDLPPSGTHVKTDILINGTDITRLPSSLHPSACGLSDLQVASSLPISFSLLGVVDDDIFSHILTFAGPPTPLLPVSRRFVPHPVEMKYLVVECEYADEWGAALIPGEDVDMIIGGAPRDDPFIRCCSKCYGVADVRIARVGTIVLQTFLALRRIPYNFDVGEYIGDRMIMEDMPLCSSCCEFIFLA